jgi:hypothetical protein
VAAAQRTGSWASSVSDSTSAERPRTADTGAKLTRRRVGAAGEVLGVGPPPKSMAAPFDWHAHPDGEIQEPPAEVVDYLEAVKSGDVDLLRSAIARGAHVDTHHRVRPLKWFGGKP